MSSTPLRLLSMGADGLVVSVEGSDIVLKLQLAGVPTGGATPPGSDPLPFLLSPLDVQIVRFLLRGPSPGKAVAKYLQMKDGNGQPTPKLKYELAALGERGVIENEDGGYRVADDFRQFLPLLPQLAD